MKKSRLPEILQAMPDAFPVDELIDKLRVLQKIEEEPKRYQRKFGSAAGKYKMAPDFNEPLDDFAAYMMQQLTKTATDENTRSV